MQIESDAYGMMVLPSGDTLKQVMRTQSIQTFAEHLQTEAGGSVTINTCQETYRWYSKGYRYPIFETIRNIVSRDSTETGRFETAFFFPPQEHYYLDEDNENLALLEELEENEASDPWAGLSYNIFPNPVKTFLELELYLPQSADIRIQVRSSMGLIVLDERKGVYPVGISKFQFNMSAVPIGNYILDVWLNDHLVSGVIMKR
jgi:hypothetical protein